MLYVSIFQKKNTFHHGNISYVKKTNNMCKKFRNSKELFVIKHVGDVKFYCIKRKNKEIVIGVANEDADELLCFEFVENIQHTDNLKKRMEEFNEGDDIFENCKRKIESTKGIMINNTKKIGDNLDALTELEMKAELLEDYSSDFKVQSVRIGRKFLKKNIIIILVIIIFVIVCIIGLCLGITFIGWGIVNAINENKGNSTLIF